MMGVTRLTMVDDSLDGVDSGCMTGLDETLGSNLGGLRDLRSNVLGCEGEGEKQICILFFY